VKKLKQKGAAAIYDVHGTAKRVPGIQAEIQSAMSAPSAMRQGAASKVGVTCTSRAPDIVEE
jgi:hypothetical protein